MIIATALLCGAFESKRPSARRETCDSSEDSVEAARTVMLARVEHAPSLSLEPICGCGVGSLEFAVLHPCCAVVDLSGVRRWWHATQLEQLWWQRATRRQWVIGSKPSWGRNLRELAASVSRRETAAVLFCETSQRTNVRQSSRL